MRKNKNTPKIVMAGIIAFLVMIAFYAYLNKMSNKMTEQQQVIDLMQRTNTAEDENASYAYAVATDNLKAGEMVTDIDVDFKEFDIKESNAFENRSDVVNKILLKDITSGEPFTSAHIAKVSSENLKLKDGYRAITLPAENFQGKSNKMVLGSSVDIYSANPEDGWVLEDIKIIALDNGESGTDQKDTNITKATAITFEVAVGEISDIISSASKGKLVLVARNANDKRIIHKMKKSSSNKSSGFSSAGASLPNLPSSPPISNLSGLPQPIQPTIQSDAVEVIEANVKSKVTFE